MSIPRRKTSYFPAPLVVGLRKAEIFSRRGHRIFSPTIGAIEGFESDVSSLEEAHSLIIEADPTLESMLRTKRKLIAKK